MKITIIDYGMGNLRSIEKAFERLKIPSVITSSKQEIENATKIVLPGVGNFKNGIEKLNRLNLINLLKKKGFR